MRDEGERVEKYILIQPTKIASISHVRGATDIARALS